MPAPTIPSRPAVPSGARPYYQIRKGVPSALVRSYKEPLYDSELVLTASPSAELVLFQKPIGQTLADAATRKTLLHTNMATAGQLGTPISFDVYGFNVRVPKGITPTDFNTLYRFAVAQVSFGQDTPFLTVPLEDIPSGVDTEGLGGSDSPHIGLGDVGNYYRFDISGQALHINSTESFQVKIMFPSGYGSPPSSNILVRWYMRGIKFKGV